jgi:methylisocitrate lyase
LPEGFELPGSGAKLRELMGQGIVAMPGAFNALSARLVQAAGFDACYISGAGVTNSLTGMPDVALLTLTEMAQQCRYITNAVSIPCIADADTGYGETLNVARAVSELEQSGLAGIHLEDQLAPKRCGHLAGKQVIPTTDMARKIAAAVKSRTDPDFMIIARTDSRSINGFNDAVARANTYLKAGADAIFPEALESPEEFAEFARQVKAPLLANMTEFGKSPLLTVDELAAMGYKMVIFPMTQLRIMNRAAEEVLKEIRQTGTQQALLDRMQTRQQLYQLIDYPAYEAFDNEIANQAI